MIKKLLIIVILASMPGCNNNQENIANLIYKTYFKDIVRISIVKAAPSINKDIVDIKQLNIIKDEMENITIIKEYTADPNYGGVFKNENFRLMFMFVKIKEKKHKVFELLYSTKDAVMIVRASDMFPNKKPKSFEEKISVYEIKIPQKVNTILKQCENELSEEGFFFNTWSDPLI